MYFNYPVVTLFKNKKRIC